ncbi:MAG: PAS domain S-box protein [Opitutaceae bacterium]
MDRSIRVLVADDSPEDAELVVRELKRAGFSIEWERVDSEADYAARLSQQNFGLVLSDYRMPQFGGLRALEILRERNLEIPFILISGTIGEETAVTAMKMGASDYLLKDRLARLGLAVTQALESNRLRGERRKAEQALHASEKLFRSTLENLMEGCQIISRDWRYVYLNEIAAGHGQKSVEDLVGRTMQECFPGIENTEMFSHLRHCMTEGKPHQFENQFACPDGSKAWYHLFIQPVPEGLFILSLDITARRQAEDALRASEARFRELLENIQLIAWTLDRDGNVTFCNDYLLRLTGWQKHEVMGKNSFTTFLPESDPETVRDFRASIVAGTFPPHHEHPIKTREGRLRDIAWSNTTLRDAQGIVRGIASIGEDITDRKQAAEKIKGQLDELRRWQDVTVGREDRILALKAEVNQLLAEQQKPARYAVESP